MRRLGRFLSGLLSVALCAIGPDPFPVLTAQGTILVNLIEYWPLNETSGNRAGAHAGKTLTDLNTVASATGHVYASAADFVGTAGSGEGLVRADEADLSTGNIPFTIAIWVLLDDKTATDRGLVGKVENQAADEMEYALEYALAADRFRFFTASATSLSNITQVDANNLGSPATGTYYLVVGFHDPTADTINIKVNNGTTDSVGYTFGSYDSDAEFAIGGADWFGNEVNGRIGPVMFWKKVLSAGEHTFLYNTGVGRTYASFFGGGALSLVGVGR